MILTAHVKPNARANKIEWLDQDTIKVWITAVPEKGKANRALIKYLAKELGVTKSRIHLVRGGTASMKQLKIES
jgi:uncharacterized protein